MNSATPELLAAASPHADLLAPVPGEAQTTSEARFRQVFTHSADAVVLLQGAYYVDCNEAALALLGLPGREHLMGQPATAFAPEHQPDGQITAELFRTTIGEALRTAVKGSCAGTPARPFGWRPCSPASSRQGFLLASVRGMAKGGSWSWDWLRSLSSWACTAAGIRQEVGAGEPGKEVVGNSSGLAGAAKLAKERPLAVGRAGP